MAGLGDIHNIFSDIQKTDIPCPDCGFCPTCVVIVCKFLAKVFTRRGLSLQSCCRLEALEG